MCPEQTVTYVSECSQYVSQRLITAPSSKLGAASLGMEVDRGRLGGRTA